jgi:hypothetical protein
MLRSLTYDSTRLEVMNPWPTNENDAGQILTVALLNINYKVQNIRKCKLKETLNKKLENDVMYSRNDICSVKIQSD